MNPVTQHLLVKQGAKFELTVDVVDGAGVPVTVTDWSAKMQIRAERDEDALLLAEWNTGDEISLVGSQVWIDVPGSQTEEYEGWTDGFYDLFVVNQSGAPYCLMQGNVRVDHRVTVL